MIIRKAHRDDSAALLEICADHDAIWGYGCPVAMNIDWWRNRIQRTENNGVLAVAQEAERILGFFEIFIDTADWVRRHVGTLGICVDAQFRRHGLGRLLLEQAMYWADDWFALQRLELFVWADHTAAIDLYEKSGFVREGIHPSFGFRAGEHVTALSMARLRETREQARAEVAQTGHAGRQ